MSTVQQRYREEKPKNCKYCYFWENKACIRGVENCYYLIKESSKIKSERTSYEITAKLRSREYSDPGSFHVGGNDVKS